MSQNDGVDIGSAQRSEQKGGSEDRAGIHTVGAPYPNSEKKRRSITKALAKFLNLA